MFTYGFNIYLFGKYLMKNLKTVDDSSYLEAYKLGKSIKNY